MSDVLAACLDICSAPPVSTLPGAWPPTGGTAVTSSSAGGPFEYTSMFTATTEPPNAAHIEFNNVDQKAATKMWVDNNTSPGTDVSNLLNFTRTNDELYLQDKTDATKYQVYKLSGAPVLKTGYIEFPIVWQRGGTVISNNQKVMLYVVRG